MPNNLPKGSLRHPLSGKAPALSSSKKKHGIPAEVRFREGMNGDPTPNRRMSKAAGQMTLGQMRELSEGGGRMIE